MTPPDQLNQTPVRLAEFRALLRDAINTATDPAGPDSLNVELQTDAVLRCLADHPLASDLARHLGCFPADLPKLIGGDA